MNKKNLKKWMLLKKESETGISLYRVLEIYYQFRYFYRKYNKKEIEYISRNGLSFYHKDH